MQALRIQFVLSASIGGGAITSDRSCTLMAWGDALAEYERGRVVKSQKDELSTQRNKLLETRHNHEWIALRQEFLNRFDIVNKRADRKVMESLSIRANALHIRREDREELKAEYKPETKTVTFSCEATPLLERSYELIVRPVEGNDTVVWRAVDNKPGSVEIVSKEDIARQIITGFLRA